MIFNSEIYFLVSYYLYNYWDEYYQVLRNLLVSKCLGEQLSYTHITGIQEDKGQKSLKNFLLISAVLITIRHIYLINKSYVYLLTCGITRQNLD